MDRKISGLENLFLLLYVIEDSLLSGFIVFEGDVDTEERGQKGAGRWGHTTPMGRISERVGE